MSMTANGYHCGYLIGGIGGGVAAGFAAAALWPVIVGAVSGVAGAFIAVVAAIAIVNSGIALGAFVGSIGLGCLGLMSHCVGFLFKSSDSIGSLRQR